MVRLWVAKNPNTPPEVLSRLLQDTEWSVAESASL